MRLDRRISATLLAELQPGGALAWLVAVAAAEPELYDVALWRSAGGKRSWAALTAGTVEVLAVDERAGLFRLRPDPSIWRSKAVPIEWFGWMTRRRLEVLWPEVCRLTGAVLGSRAVADAVRDPRAQTVARLGAPGAGPLRVITRGPRITWERPIERDATVARVLRPLRRALATGPDRAWWPRPKQLRERRGLVATPPDLLATDPGGRILVVEVAGGASTSPAAPVRARFGAELVGELLRIDAGALDVLAGMLAQRSGLGLTAPGRGLAAPARVVPVVLVDDGGDGPAGRADLDKAVHRIRSVVEALSRRPPASALVDPPEVWLVDQHGTLTDVIDLGGDPSPGPVGSGPFLREARAAAVAWKRSTRCLPDEAREPAPYQGRGPALELCLPERYARLNLLPEAREIALDRFRSAGIDWHHGVDDGPSNHLLSSQVQCANALGPVVSRPDSVRALFASVVPVGSVLRFGASPPGGDLEGHDPDDHVVFDWGGSVDHLGDAATARRAGPRSGRPDRPAGVTRADAAFRYLTADGQIELVLVAWRYADRLRPDRADAAALDARVRRYRAHVEDPDGPVRQDLVPLEDLLVDPFDRLLRLQVLAWRMEQAQELGARRVRVVLVAPSANRELWTSLRRRSHHTLGGGYGAVGLAPARSVLDVWRALQRRPDRFAHLDTATLVGPAAPTSADFRHRYGHMAATAGTGFGWSPTVDEERLAAEARLFASVGLARAVLGRVGGADGPLGRVDRGGPAAGTPTAVLVEVAARLEELAELGRRVPVDLLPDLSAAPTDG